MPRASTARCSPLAARQGTHHHSLIVHRFDVGGHEREQHAIVVGQNLRPPIAAFARPDVGTNEFPGRAAAGRNLPQPRHPIRDVDDPVVPRPRGAVGGRRDGERDRAPSPGRNDLQTSVGEEPDPGPVRGEERQLRSVGAWNDGLLLSFQLAEAQPMRATALGHEDDLEAVPGNGERPFRLRVRDRARAGQLETDDGLRRWPGPHELERTGGDGHHDECHDSAVNNRSPPKPRWLGRPDRLAGTSRVSNPPQFVGDVVRRVPTGVGVLRQALCDEPRQAGRRLRLQRRERRWFVLQNRRHDLRRRVADERAHARQHLVEQRPERPDVGARVDRLPFHLLRRHVRHGAKEYPALGE
jgi:hypothetical protein